MVQWLLLMKTRTWYLALERLRSSLSEIAIGSFLPWNENPVDATIVLPQMLKLCYHVPQITGSGVTLTRSWIHARMRFYGSAPSPIITGLEGQCWKNKTITRVSANYPTKLQDTPLANIYDYKSRTFYSLCYVVRLWVLVIPSYIISLLFMSEGAYFQKCMFMLKSWQLSSYVWVRISSKFTVLSIVILSLVYKKWAVTRNTSVSPKQNYCHLGS